jgi:hypothetical protein
VLRVDRGAGTTGCQRRRRRQKNSTPGGRSSEGGRATKATERARNHPSGHAAFSSAFVHTLQDFFGTDKIAFSNKSCTTRSFDRFSDALNEIIDARMWSGIHFRTPDTQGAVLGKKVAHHLEKHYFQPVQ